MEEEFNRMRAEFDFPIVGCVCGESSGTNYASYREYIEAADRPFAFMAGQSNDGELGKLIDCHVKVSNDIELPPKMVEIMLSELASKHRIE
ncbi:hypothetical protein K2173_009507 [Erythroxylum novogranatense]|uniref:Uncharacterized protein n=1 Tax=Erythroxylum novogranatense TaxID=1862640 RepID=A0AAV8U5C4_9ROSI|nr:hypothetical protein K2173_009507 [Erythroxylum novogranatense]